jgi:hypothetical protein
LLAFVLVGRCAAMNTAKFTECVDFKGAPTNLDG